MEIRVKVKKKGQLASSHGKDYASGVNQEPLQMQSCEPPAALNVLLWPVVSPKNRVGGSPAFSFVFTFQFIGETLDAPAENGGCGYDFASGVHKYLYGADDPVNNEDPSGNDYGSFDISLATIFLPFLKVPMLASSIENLTGSSAFDPTSALPIMTLQDFDIDGQLHKLFLNIRWQEHRHGPLPLEPFSVWRSFMRGSRMDTDYKHEPGYRFKYVGTEHPLLLNRTFINSDINYIGVGTGFAARLDNPAEMVFWTTGWLEHQYGVSGSSNLWAAEKTGYDAFNQKFHNN